MAHNIPPQGGDAPTAKAKGLLMKIAHAPKEKPVGHTDGLSRAHRSVANNGVKVPGLVPVPPGHCQKLFRSEWLILHEAPPWY